MTSLKNYIPDEWQSAFSAAKDVHRVAAKTSHASFKASISLLFPFALGFATTYIIKPSLKLGFITAGMATVGVLFGFLMSLMLFTGKLSGADYLSYEASNRYKDKILYLLWSQTLTLMAYVFTLFVGTFCFLFADSSELVPIGFASFFIGGIFACFFRSAILPYQLIDMHNFNLTMLTNHKKAERENRIQNELEDIGK